MFALSACAGLVGIEDDFPLDPTKDAGSDTGNTVDAAPDAPPDSSLDAPSEASLDEMVCCGCSKGPVTGAENEVFKDVGPSAAEAESVAALHALGIVSGCESFPPLFCPACELTRSALAKWVVLASGVPLVERDVPTFPDVPKNHASYDFIETAFENGFMEGFPEGTFEPDSAISRGATAVIVVKAAALPVPAPLEQSFTDVTIGSWWHPSIEALFAACVTTGCSMDGPQFCPSKLITRRGAVVLVARAFGFVAPSCTIDPG